MLSVGIIKYPGSNCDIDTYNYFNNWVLGISKCKIKAIKA